MPVAAAPVPARSYIMQRDRCARANSARPGDARGIWIYSHIKNRPATCRSHQCVIHGYDTSIATHYDSARADGRSGWYTARPHATRCRVNQHYACAHANRTGTSDRGRNRVNGQYACYGSAPNCVTKCCSARAYAGDKTGGRNNSSYCSICAIDSEKTAGVPFQNAAVLPTQAKNAGPVI